MPGLFDLQNRLTRLEQADPLSKLNALVPWEEFRLILETINVKERKSNAGRKPFDVVLMFKVLVLQSLYNLSDDSTEFQVRDRLSFMRFLGLEFHDSVPDAKTIWLFRERLTEAGLVEKLFVQFDGYLTDNGFAARKGQIIDASIVSAPRQRNTREDNALIKEGGKPENWSESRSRQKDTDARWVKKNGVSRFGYKSHVSVDVKHKFIRKFDVTDAAAHDSNRFETLLDENNTSREVYADSAYRSKETIDNLVADKWRPRIQRKGVRGRKLSSWELQGNRTRSKTRSRVEHVFGVMAMRAGTLIIRTVGAVRAKAKIGLRNLAFNLDRFAMLSSKAA
jgi:IS5 family transposase